MAGDAPSIDEGRMQPVEPATAIASRASALLAELQALRAESEALRRELDAWAPDARAGDGDAQTCEEAAASDRPTLPMPAREIVTMPAAAA